MNRRTLAIAGLLLLSGLCALLYQTVWFRAFRAIFGTSTAATGAVLAVFMGGLGLGSLWLGKRAEEHPNPLLLYGLLEVGIALTAAVSLGLLWLVDGVYVFVGGSATLGGVGATAARLLLAPLVIGAPVVLMGGTLPAAARAVTVADDLSRRGLSLLYGLNASGAVLGVLLTTFLLFERYGLRATLLGACALNLCVGLVAIASARRLSPRELPPPAASAGRAAGGREAPARWVLVAAFTTGFCFLLGELVWYRLAAPILGGSTYTFGLVLATALAGVGAGGVAYSWLGSARPSPGQFALTCALEALALMVPFALGDDLAHLAVHLRQLSSLGFGGLVAGWVVITGLLVFPAALVAGYQFPLLLALMGRGPERVALDVGRVYAANTLGSILGSLAGGFGLLPLLSAPGAWRLTAAALLVAGVPFARRGRRRDRQAFVLLCLCTWAAFLTPGPTAFWRHGGVGAGRSYSPVAAPNRVEEETQHIRRSTVLELEGWESSLGISSADGLAFYVNGKSDGNAIADAGTTVRMGLLGAMLHPNPRKAFVIGLGAGQTAGWLAAAPELEEVQCVELEPAVIEFARLCEPVNQGALENPKLKLSVGDAREVLKTTADRFDLIASEPSNPYRAGVASFYTADFYREARAKLNPGGLLLQWIQAYEISPETLSLCLGTARRVFPHISLWATKITGDLVMVASDVPLPVDGPRVQRLLGQEPYRSAFGRLAGIYDLEGFLSQHVANDAFCARASARLDQLNTDDQPVAEFGFARAAGFARSGVLEILNLAESLDAESPTVHGVEVDWGLVSLLRARSYQTEGKRLPPLEASGLTGKRIEYWRALSNGKHGEATRLLKELPPPPAHDLFERLLRLEALLVSGRPSTEKARASLEADLAELSAGGLACDVALLRLISSASGNYEPERVVERARQAFAHMRGDAWFKHGLGRLALDRLLALPKREPEAVAEIVRALAEGPFLLNRLERRRQLVVLHLGDACGEGQIVSDCLEQVEPHPYWAEELLLLRLRTYRATRPDLVPLAEEDLARCRGRERPPLSTYFSEKE